MLEFPCKGNLMLSDRGYEPVILIEQFSSTTLRELVVTRERLYDELNALATEHLMCELGH